LGANILTDVYLEKQFISRLVAGLVCTPLGLRSSLPDNTGKKVRWQYSSQPAALSATTEGTNPSDNTFSTTTAEGTLLEYKSEMEASRFLLRTGLSAWLEEVIDAVGYQMQDTFDTAALAALDATTVTVDAGTAMTADATRQGVQKLVVANVKPHPMTAGGRFYPAIYSGEACYDMMGEGAPAWFQVKSSLYLDSLITPFDGTPASSAVYGAMIKLSNNVRAQTAEDYNVIVGKEAFGIAALDTDVIQPRVFVTRPDERVDLPARNKGSVGTFALFVAKLLDNARVCMVKSDVT
jgi:N4-gp56 family major capsid protein